MDPRIATRIDRYRRLCAPGRPGDLLVVLRQDPPDLQARPLLAYDFDQGGHLALAADAVDRARVILQQSLDADDDLVPWLVPDFGIAINHAFLFDLPVRFAEDTSWAPHPLDDDDAYERLDAIAYDPGNKWVRRIKEMHQFWRERADPSCVRTSFYHFSPLNLANALRGDSLFMDFYDKPDAVRNLLERCTRAIGDLEADLAPLLADQPGTAASGALAPKGSLFLYEDTMDMCGPDLAAAWGAPWSTALRDRFGAVTLYHHMMGQACHRVIGQVAQGSLIRIADNPNCPPAADALAELYADSGDNALMFDCTLAELRALEPVLPRIRGVAVVPVGNDPAAAREAVARIRTASNLT